jgi:cell division GTPase FtsZ
MELQFNIPILKIDLDEWLKENEINQSIYDTYSELSELRRAELKKLSTAVTDDSGK